jgi:hypothetical integral membrane protein (TIGR02206 family)
MAQFSKPHLAALAVWLLITIVSVAAARHSSPQARWTYWFSAVTAAGILVAWAGEYVADVITGVYTVQYTLPLQLTDLTSMASAFALLTRRQLAVELAYFLALTGALQATITPDLYQNFPSVYYFTYFMYHIGALVAAVFLVWGLGIRLRRWAALRGLIAVLAWAAIAGIADVITGGNYMYLAWKPEHGSLLSVMGPWPWYIVAGVGVAVVMMALVNAITRGLWRLVEGPGGAAVDAAAVSSDPAVPAGSDAAPAGSDTVPAGSDAAPAGSDAAAAKSDAVRR